MGLSSRGIFTGYILLLVLTLSSCLSRPEKRISKARPIPVNSEKKAKGNLLTRYAEQLGVQENELDNAALYAFIDDWMGAPHRLGGLNKSGIDCSAFINQLVSKVYGKNLPRSSFDMAEEVKRKYENQLVEGDLVFFSFGKKKVDHVGLYLRNNKFIHVSTSKGVMISDLHESWFYRYFVRAGTVR